MATMNAKVVHATIARDWKQVYDFAHKPENMPKWASGLANGLKQDGETGPPMVGLSARGGSALLRQIRLA